MPRPIKTRRAQPTRRSWLTHTYHAEVQVDSAGPTWDPKILEEVQLPRWWYDHHEDGIAVFLRASQKRSGGPTEATLWIDPKPAIPAVRLEIGVHGLWEDEDTRYGPGSAAGEILEEAEALLVLLGCRSPRFRYVESSRRR